MLHYVFLTTIKSFTNIRSRTFTEHSRSLNVDYRSGYDTENLSENSDSTEDRVQHRVSIINTGENDSGKLTHDRFGK